MKAFKAALMVTAALLLLLGVGSTSYAGDPSYFELKLSDGATTVTVLDGTADDGSAPVGVIDGIIIYSGSVGANWFINVTTGVTYPSLGSAALPTIDLNSFNMTAAGSGDLTIDASVINFTAVPLNDALMVAGKTDGTISFKDFYNPANVYFGGVQVAALGPFGPGAFSGTATVFVANPAGAGGLYSLTTEAVIQHMDAYQVTSLDASTVPVPEPISLLLLGCGLLGVATLRRGMKK